MIQTVTHQAAAVLTTAPSFGSALASLPVSTVVALTGVVVVVATLLIAAVFAALIQRSAKRQSRAILDSSNQLAQQLEQLQGALAAADARVAALAARQEEHSRTAQGGASTSYNVAIRLARSGASRQELMSTCGVTQQEADLVLRLHAADPSVRSAA
jgi:cell division protein ZapA (FtsZ GTPase activity inhibitor)